MLHFQSILRLFGPAPRRVRPSRARPSLERLSDRVLPSVVPAGPVPTYVVADAPAVPAAAACAADPSSTDLAVHVVGLDESGAGVGLSTRASDRLFEEMASAGDGVEACEPSGAGARDGGAGVGDIPRPAAGARPTAPEWLDGRFQEYGRGAAVALEGLLAYVLLARRANRREAEPTRKGRGLAPDPAPCREVE